MRKDDPVGVRVGSVKMERKAYFDKNKIYRYLLTRKWGNSGQKITWIMLNPSTTDDTIDDPTIRRCIVLQNN